MNLFKEFLAHSKNKFATVANIFRVYIILLEYTCKSDYKMVISALTEGHKKELNEMKAENEKAMEELNERMEEAVQSEEFLLKEIAIFKKRAEEERMKREKLEEEVIGKE